MSESHPRTGLRALLLLVCFVALQAAAQSTNPMLVKDIVPGSSDSNPTGLMASDTTLYFSTWNAGRFYRSDGTDAGTLLLSDVSFANSSEWTLFQSQVYFAAHDGTGTELWRVNAAGDGTELVKDFTSTNFDGGEPRQLTPALGRIFFSAFDDAAGRELWTSDGTTAGTVRVLDLRSNGSSDPRLFRELNGSVYFVADDDGGVARLWKTNGTSAGTAQFTTLAIGKLSYDQPMLVVYGGYLYFSATSASGTELWRSDGTVAGTALVADIAGGAASSFPHQPFVAGSRLYFAAQNPLFGDELFTIAAPGQSPVLVADLNPGAGSSFPFALQALDNALIFSAANRLWKADGTTVTQLLDTGTSASAKIGRFVYFAASRPATGYELWVTDGTPQGTHIVLDQVFGTGSSYPGGLTAVGTTLYYVATTPFWGNELWRLDTCDATVAASGPTTFCAGGSVTLTASPGTSYLWSNGATTQSIDATASGSYSVTVGQANGCSATSLPTTVAVQDAPAATIDASSTTLCASGTVTLTASPAASYLWSTGATTQSISVNAPGTFTVTVSDGQCSKTSAPVTIVQETTTVSISGSDNQLCPGESVTVTSAVNGSAASYQWYGFAGHELPGETGASLTITPSQIGTGYYFLRVTTAGGCVVQSNTFVFTVTQPDATIAAGGPTTFCEGSSVTLSAPDEPGNSWLWSTGATSRTIVAAASGTYSVTVTNANGCSRTSEPVVVTVHATPQTPVITAGGPTTFCDGGSVTLTAPAADNWLWSNGATSQSIAVDASGTYSVTVTNASGCSATSSPVLVTENPKPATPVVSASGPTTFCEGGSVTLTAPAGFTYLWSNGATSQSIVAAASGSYSVTVTNGNGCSATSAPAVITVNPKPATPVVSASGPTTFCAGGSVTLTAPAGFTYLWSNGATTQSIAATTSGPYSVTVTNGSGCSTTSAATAVTVTPATSIAQQPASVTIPKNTSHTLSVAAAGTGTLTYQWYRGTSGNTSTPIVGATSTTYSTGKLSRGTYSYWVRVTGTCGSADSATATITAQ